MNIVLIDRVRSLRRTVAGRLVQCAADIERVLGARRHPAVEPHVRRAREAARAYIDLRARRDAQHEIRNDGRAKQVDAETDIVLAGLHGTAQRYARRLPEHPKGKAGARIMRSFFRRGLGAVTNIPYEDELVQAEYIHEGLSTTHADDAALLGLGAGVEELGGLLPQYREALSMEEKIKAAEVAAAYEAMQVAYFRLAFAIAAMVEDADDQAALLAPIFEQDDRLAAIYAARRAGQSGLGEGADDPDAEVDALLAEELAEAAAAREAEAAEGVDEIRAEVGAPDDADAGEAPRAVAPDDAPRQPLRPIPAPGDDGP